MEGVSSSPGASQVRFLELLKGSEHQSPVCPQGGTKSSVITNLLFTLPLKSSCAPWPRDPPACSPTSLPVSGAQASDRE